MEHGNGLLSLGSQRNLNFPSDGTVWKGSIALAEPNASSGMALASHGGGVEEKESTCILKEHDYIGLTEVSSVKPSRTEKDGALKAQKEGNSKPPLETSSYSFAEGLTTFQKPWQNTGLLRPMTAETLNSPNQAGAREYENSNKVPMYVQDFGDGPLRAGMSSTLHGKNGTKRGYTEAMNDTTRFNVATGASTGTAVVGKNIEGEVKVLPKHQQGAYMPNWVPLKPNVPAHRPVALEKASAHAFPMNKLAVEKSAADHAPSTFNAPESSKEPATNEPPPPKGQAVGWPPIRSYRKHNLAKPIELYVKVNMDGMTVGRKVDLNAHSSYEGLLSALEEMFQPSSNGGQGTSQSVGGRESHTNDCKQFRLLNGSDYVLTYEDQDGDWMLVGDVPWSMFVTMVRRLRITRGSEATGLAPTRRPDNIK
ncbi:hypothetical protein GOP47_0017914 [Adiantum capillus-veneris]|uniref:Auxin-responsive protein n=1 Tax=Adiantum capillus-veneris TaxID=13818 RepID=A0A9D4UGB4_ADICA|nr:hypothetical protein GOP47_0017914 [Adiantum capillus-veneris]